MRDLQLMSPHTAPPLESCAETAPGLVTLSLGVKAPMNTEYVLCPSSQVK